MTDNAKRYSPVSSIPQRTGLSGRAKARIITFAAYSIAAVGLVLGNYTYYLYGAHHDRSGDKVGFVLWTLIAIAFVGGTFLTRWLAIVSCIMAGMGFFMFITYPLTTSLSHFWGQALALACYVVAFVSSIMIITSTAEQSAQPDQQ